MKREEIPVLPLPMIETHCHLDYLKEHSPEEVVEKCNKLRVEYLVTISVQPSNMAAALKMTELPGVFCTQGIHPHHADEFDQSARQKIKENLSHDKVVAVGEIGLDYHYNHSSKENQLRAFEEQINLAIEFDLPVVIHSREAEDDTIKVLTPYIGKVRGVVHSFTSLPVLADFAIESGLYLGFNGIITFKNAEQVRAVVETTPLENILLETDSPFLTPDPYRGRENAPYFLPFVARKIAQIKSCPVETVLKSTYDNSQALFKCFPPMA